MRSDSSSKSSRRPPSDAGRAPLSWRSAGWSLAVFVLLTVLHTWPLVTAPGTLSRNDNGDTVLNEWTMAWVQHQVVRDPVHLFDANIFYPERNALAISEHLFTQAMLGLPFQLAGASPVLVYNLVLLAGFALTGWATCLVVYRATGDWMAGVLSGTLIAFNAYALTHFPHIQTLHLEFLAPAILALHQLILRPAAIPAVLLAVAFTLQALTSNYFAASIGFAVAAAVAVRPLDCWRARGRLVLWGALSLAIAIVLLLPFVLPYVEMRYAHGFQRPLDFRISATWRDYLTTGSRLHFDWWSRRYWAASSAPLFPGITALVFALAALVSGTAWRDRFARMWVGIAVLLGLLSLGAYAPWYRWLWEHSTVVQGIRSPARLGQFVVAAVAVLAGFGLAWVRGTWSGRRSVTVLSIAAIVLANAEAIRAPIHFVKAPPIPPAYDLLAREKRAIIAEFPFPPPHNFFLNAGSMLASTRHWHPILNGYSGFVPVSYKRAWESLKGFPDNPSLRALRALGVTHVVIHYKANMSMVGTFRRRPLPPALETVAETDALGIYHLRWERIPDVP